MKFTKMHGIGNDYVYVNGFVETVADPARLAPIISDHHTGIGGDGLILILPSDKADVRMRMFNADGSESEMCGNGIRCVAKYAYDHGLARSNPMRIETGRGVLAIALEVHDGKVRQATVNMGEPILELPRIPVDPAMVRAAGTNAYVFADPSEISNLKSQISNLKSQISNLKSEISNLKFPMTFVSMGNPHATVFVDDVRAVDLARIGPLIEHHPAFPRRINAHFVQVHAPQHSAPSTQHSSEVTMRTWERGSGITLACGTGACAVCVAGVLTGRTGRKILAHLPGGDLTLEWRESDNCVYMTGPATEVFEGVWNGQ
ncbi:MAG: diaminopimelate epimerase [Tepidisphaerales bacterium]